MTDDINEHTVDNDYTDAYYFDSTMSEDCYSHTMILLDFLIFLDSYLNAGMLYRFCKLTESIGSCI